MQSISESENETNKRKIQKVPFYHAIIIILMVLANKNCT